MCLNVYVQKSAFHLINVFCVIVVKKYIMAGPGSLLVFCAAQKQDTFSDYDQRQSYTFAQPAVQTARWS